MSKHIFKVSSLFKFGNGMGISEKLIEIELSDYTYPYTFLDAWEWAVDQASQNLKLDNLENIKSVTITYEGEL